MSLRKKIVLLILTGFVISLILGFVSLFWIITSKYDYIENSISNEKTKERVDVINNGIDTMRTLSSDWGGWDDTYEYIKDRNQQFIDSNLYPGEYAVLKVNAIALTDINKNIVYFGSRDYINNQEFKNNQEAKELIQKILGEIKFNKIHDVISGYIGKENIYYFSAHQILPSVVTEDTTSNGVIIFLRQLDYTDPLNFGITIPQNSTVQILPYNKISNLNLDNNQVNKLNLDLKISRDITSTKINVVSLIKDYYGNPLFVLSINSEKVYSTEVMSTLFTVYLTLVVILGLIVLTFYLSIERNVFSKLSFITIFLEQINDPMNTKERIIKDLGPDFLKLENTINSLLNKVQEQKNELEKVNSEFKSQNEDLLIRQKELDERNRELNSLNQTMVGREMRMIELKNQVEDLSKKVNELDKKSDADNNPA